MEYSIVLMTQGIIFYVLVCGKVPFDDPNLPQLHAKIKSGIVSYPDHLSKDCKDLLSQILVVDPNKRAKMAHIKSHCWFKDRKQFEVYALPRIPEAPLNQDVIDKLQVFGYCSTKDSEDAMDLARHVHQTFDRLVPHPSISREFQIPVASMYVLIEDNIKALQNCSITVNGCPQQERRAGKLNKKQSKAFKLRNKITSKLKKIKGALKISESHSEPNRRNTISIPLGSMDTSKKAEVDHTPVIASLSASNSRESMNASESDFSGLEVLSDSEVHNVKSRLGKRPLRHRSQNTRMLEERRPESISRRHSLASRPPKDASDTIDHNLKQIFFGRIFSVSNTSTKSPTVVRMALLKVLIQISESGMITFQERFGSVYVTSASPFSEQQTVEGMPMPTVPLQMQIRLVQIRWTKLIGIRFKRMNGDAVQYSKLCRLILDSLKL